MLDLDTIGFFLYMEEQEEEDLREVELENTTEQDNRKKIPPFPQDLDSTG